MGSKQEFRNVFNRQPAYFLFLDAAYPMDFGTFNSICDNLSNITSLIAGMKGSVRVNVFGVYYVAEKANCVFQLQPLKLNFSRLHASLECMKNVFSVEEQCGLQTLSDCLNDAIRQYEKHFEGTSEEERPLLQITMLSSRPMDTLKDMASNAVAQSRHSCLRKFEAIYLPHRMNPVPADQRSISSSPFGQDLGLGRTQGLTTGSPSSSNQAETGLGLIEVYRLENNIFQLENLFKRMLHDFTTDVDHMRIMINDENLMLRCDMQERLLNTHCFYGGSNFTLPLEAGHLNFVMPNLAKGGSSKVPICTLDVVGLVRKTGVCESLTFGQPVLIGPTMCWKYEWEELKSNHQYFRAINEYLQKQNVVMVAKSRDQSENQESNPKGHFVIFPTSTDGSMLIKAVACKEIYIPMSRSSILHPDEIVPDYTISTVEENFRSFDIQNILNPLYISSNLYEHITGILRKIRPPNKAAVRDLTNQLRGERRQVSQSSNEDVVCIGENRAPLRSKWRQGSDYGSRSNELLANSQDKKDEKNRPIKTFVPRFVSAAAFLREGK